MPVGERAAGRLDDFERACDAGAIARLQPFGGDGIAPRQFRMQRLHAIAIEPRAHALSHIGRNWRHSRQPPRDVP